MPVPLAYPQVVFLAVRVYFMLCLVSRQFLVTTVQGGENIDYYVPFMTMIQVIATWAYYQFHPTAQRPALVHHLHGLAESGRGSTEPAR